MKTILLILLNLQLVYGTTFNSTSSVYDRNRGIPNSEYRVGYTTPYGYGFNRNSTIGYPQNTYVNSNPTFGYNPSGSRKSKERPYSGGSFEDLLDWLRMQTDANWPSYVDSVYWKQFLKEHGEYYDEVWDYYQMYPEIPNNPFKTPIGDPPFFVMLGLLFLWMAYDIFIKPTIKKDNK